MKIINHNNGTTTDYTEAEFNMYNLQCIAQENTLTLEQQNAIDYGISAIKTLADMGIIKSEWEQDHIILKAYSDGANDVLDNIIADNERLLVNKMIATKSSNSNVVKGIQVD